VSTTQARPGWFVLLRDTAIFLTGLAIVLKQAGIFFASPEAGPNIVLIVLGGLFCNGPVVLQALALRFGTGGSSPAPPPPGPDLQSVPSSGPSSGGE
jgi:hypothetical protein